MEEIYEERYTSTCPTASPKLRDNWEKCFQDYMQKISKLEDASNQRDLFKEFLGIEYETMVKDFSRKKNLFRGKILLKLRYFLEALGYHVEELGKLRPPLRKLGRLIAYDVIDIREVAEWVQKSQTCHLWLILHGNSDISQKKYPVIHDINRKHQVELEAKLEEWREHLVVFEQVTPKASPAPASTIEDGGGDEGGIERTQEESVSSPAIGEFAESLLSSLVDAQKLPQEPVREPTSEEKASIQEEIASLLKTATSPTTSTPAISQTSEEKGEQPEGVEGGLADLSMTAFAGLLEIFEQNLVQEPEKRIADQDKSPKSLEPDEGDTGSFEEKEPPAETLDELPPLRSIFERKTQAKSETLSRPEELALLLQLLGQYKGAIDEILKRISSNGMIPARKIILDELARLVKMTIPLAKLVDSDYFTPEDRRTFRKLTAEEGVFEAANLLNRLCGEQARGLMKGKSKKD